MTDFRIKKADLEEVDASYRLLTLVEKDLRHKGRGFVALEELPLEKYRALAEEIDLYVFYKGKRLIGSTLLSHNVEDSFFPVSHSYKKSGDLLEKMGYYGENLCILSLFIIHPDYQRKGNGRTLFNSLFSSYKGSSFLTAIAENNEDARDFFLRLGFVDDGVSADIELGPDHHFYYKRYVPTGLCREAKW